MCHRMGSLKLQQTKHSSLMEVQKPSRQPWPGCLSLETPLLIASLDSVFTLFFPTLPVSHEIKDS